MDAIHFRTKSFDYTLCRVGIKQGVATTEDKECVTCPRCKRIIEVREIKRSVAERKKQKQLARRKKIEVIEDQRVDITRLDQSAILMKIRRKFRSDVDELEEFLWD